MPQDVDSARKMIRHAVAAMVYRGAKTLTGAAADFALYRVKPESRTPVEIVAHMGDLLDWSLSMAKGKEAWRSSAPPPWEAEVARFYASVKAFDSYLEGSSPIACPLENLFQGPIADAISHVGQLAMLRHLFGTPIVGENYFKADIRVGQVSADQPAPRKVF